MLEAVNELTSRQLDALADLEARVLAVDGGRLKLEWGVLRSGRNVDSLLWWDRERLLGFLGLYSFDPTAAELAGMVDPAARRTGIATALLDAAMPTLERRAFAEVLLIVPRRSVAGRELALKRGGSLDHSEHALVQLEAPPDGPEDPRVTLRTATTADIPELSPILAAAFGQEPTHLLESLAHERAETLVIELDGSTVGTLRVQRDPDTAGIYGFAVDPAWQGRGIGRDILRRTCRRLRAEGVERIHLEVEVDNDHALGLYTSLRFEAVTTEDYYALPDSAR